MLINFYIFRPKQDMSAIIFVDSIAANIWISAVIHIPNVGDQQENAHIPHLDIFFLHCTNIHQYFFFNFNFLFVLTFTLFTPSPLISTLYLDSTIATSPPPTKEKTVSLWKLQCFMAYPTVYTFVHMYLHMFIAISLGQLFRTRTSLRLHSDILCYENPVLLDL